MAGRGASYILGDDQDDVIVRVKKPVSNSSLEIRDAILREYFGYTEMDINELKRQKPDKFFYVREGTQLDWATFEQVLSWRTDSSDYLSIPIGGRIVREVIAFRDWRIFSAINQAVLSIDDLELRKAVADDLRKLLSLAEGEHLSALNDLLTTTTASLISASQISTALAYLTDKAGYKDNAFLILIKANVAFTQAKMLSGPGYDVDAQTLIAEAVRKAGNNFNYGTEKSASALTRQEEAFINRHASFLYNQLGNDREARERDWIARFYEMTDAERSTLREGDIIELVSPVTAVGTPRPNSKAENELNDLENREAQRRALNDSIDQIGSRTVPTDHRTGEYYQRPTDQYELDVLKQRKVRSTGSQNKFKVVHVAENPYSRANILADGIGAALDLPQKAIKYGVTLRRLNELTAYLAARDRLLKKVKNERQYAVPPKPETIETLIKQVQRYGRITVNPFEKTRAQMTLRQLEQLWEESNAFWKTGK